MTVEEAMRQRAFSVSRGDMLAVLVPETWAPEHIEKCARLLAEQYPDVTFIMLPGDLMRVTPTFARQMIEKLWDIAQTGAGVA